jgi:hypothetical protein
MKRLRALVRRAIDRTIDAFGPHADSLEPAAHGNRVPDNGMAKFPQQPMILGRQVGFLTHFPARANHSQRDPT